jgi:hypothetical protein
MEEDFNVICDSCGKKFGNHHMDDWCPLPNGGYSTLQTFSSVDHPELVKEQVASSPECENCGYTLDAHSEDTNNCPDYSEDGDFCGYLTETFVSCDYMKPTMVKIPSSSFVWVPISQECFDSPISSKIAALANCLAGQDISQIEDFWRAYVEPHVNKIKQKDKTLFSYIKPGDWAIGLDRRKSSKTMLICGKIVADPIFVDLPSIRVGQNGLLYEISGAWLNLWGTEYQEIEGWGINVVCDAIWTESMLDERAWCELPYYMKGI